MEPLTNHDYAKFAQGDRDWIQLVASARIEGITIDPRDEVLAGRFLKGEITQGQWGQTISAQLGYQPEAAESKTEAWLKRTAPLIHKMSYDEDYRRDVAARIT